MKTKKIRSERKEIPAKKRRKIPEKEMTSATKKEEAMNVDVIAKNLTISEETRNYVHDEIKRILKVFNRTVLAHIVLERLNRYEYSVQLVVNVPQKTLTAREDDDDLIKAVDRAVDKMVRQIKKYKGHFENRDERAHSKKNMSRDM